MGEFKLELQSGNAQFGSKSVIFFLSHVTLKFDRLLWKTIRHLFYAASSFVHHFIAISEFKLELQNGNAQFASKSTIYFAMWPWNLMDDLLKIDRAPLLSNMNLCVSFHNHMWIQTGVTVRKHQIWVNDFFVLLDLSISQMTLKNNRAPLLCYFKLCALFQSHWWIQTGVTVQKRLIWVKIDDFFSLVTLKFDGWPRKSIGHISLATSSFVHHFIIICEFKLELWSGNGLVGFWPL